MAIAPGKRLGPPRLFDLGEDLAFCGVLVVGVGVFRVMVVSIPGQRRPSACGGGGPSGRGRRFRRFLSFAERRPPTCSGGGPSGRGCRFFLSFAEGRPPTCSGGGPWCRFHFYPVVRAAPQKMLRSREGQQRPSSGKRGPLPWRWGVAPTAPSEAPTPRPRFFSSFFLLLVINQSI